MDVLIFCGQSNMQGESEGLPFNNTEVQNAKQYLHLSRSLVPLKHPVGEDIYGEGQLLLASACNGCGTLVPAFCRQYTQTSGNNVVAIHVANGRRRTGNYSHDGMCRVPFARGVCDGAVVGYFKGQNRWNNRCWRCLLLRLLGCDIRWHAQQTNAGICYNGCSVLVVFAGCVW